MDKLRKELRDLKDEGVESLIHLTYDRLANGGRYPRPAKKIDPESEEALIRLFNIPERRKQK